MTPTLEHEVPVEMIRRRPDLALELLTRALEADGAGYSDAREESVDMSHRLMAEARADSVVSVKGPDGLRRYLIVEIQRRYREEKVWAWIGYSGGLMSRKKGGVILLVVCPDEATAARYRVGVRIADSSLLFVPVVLSPKMMQPIRDPEEIRRFPELATLAAAAHPNDLETARAVAEILVQLDDEASLFYYDFLRQQLPEKIRIDLEELMITYDVSKRLPDRFTKPIEDAAEARGEETGALREAIRGLLSLLDARGLAITDDQRATIESCADKDLLHGWFVRAVTAGSTAEVFGED
ncbi:hypothetical protein SAMN05444920_105301 [Nonomuraea solani]|uniref:Uncharacterized protein n=1 Tax=Nonomuraea solani TaxID=1144553 RepID=A0A1H6DFM2_9ACTN|nr:hypothetical protein [Nonomuraea solani]SEG84030.1 hypothetical protein SAMN05444920_105301 [Nonomuraea solani]